MSSWRSRRTDNISVSKNLFPEYNLDLLQTMSYSTVSTTEQPIQQCNGKDDNIESTPMSQLLLVSTTVLQQALDLVENVLSCDDQLTAQSKFLPGSTIGKHLRHARDHFVLLVDCIMGPEPHILSYDTRSRNTPMETSLSSARDAIKDAISRLEEVVPKAHLEQPVTLNAVTPFMQTLETTFGRELWFASLHAVHHWSMVRVIAGELDITLQDGFGFAPSTLLYKGCEGLSGKAKI